jgi:hypothetical protein
MNGLQLLSLNTGLQASLLVDGLGPLVELAVSVSELIPETDGNESSPVETLQSEIQPFAKRAKFWVGARAQSEHGKTVGKLKFTTKYLKLQRLNIFIVF